jgi:ribosomal protein L40E
MQYPQCQQENPPQAKFCLECDTHRVLTCAQCGTELPAGAKFCLECGQPVGARPVAPSRFTTPATYTPKHLAEKILTAHNDLEGECKQVTVLFADIQGSTELIEDLDPKRPARSWSPHCTS